MRYLYEKRYLNEQQYSIGVSAVHFQDAKELCKSEFPLRYDIYIRENMKLERDSMIINISPDEMPMQLRNAAKSVCHCHKTRPDWILILGLGIFSKS